MPAGVPGLGRPRLPRSLHPIQEGIARRLRYWRLSHGLTQKDVGKALGISHTAWAAYEVGQNWPRPHLLHKLAQMYNADLNYIIGGKPAPYAVSSWLMHNLREEEGTGEESGTGGLAR